MPDADRMRYYPAVGPAIPHFKAGCSRVTHPFAGCPLRSPLDLHVLSTPPAFVLSQDQTLQEEFNQLSRTAHNTHCWTIMRRSGINKKSEFNLLRGALHAVAQTRSPRTFVSLDSIINQRPTFSAGVTKDTRRCRVRQPHRLPAFAATAGWPSDGMRK